MTTKLLVVLYSIIREMQVISQKVEHQGLIYVCVHICMYVRGFKVQEEYLTLLGQTLKHLSRVEVYHHGLVTFLKKFTF